MSEIGPASGIQTGVGDASIGTNAHIESGVHYVPTDRSNSIISTAQWRADMIDKLERIEGQRDEYALMLLETEQILLTKIAELSERLYTPWYARLWAWTKGWFA